MGTNTLVDSQIDDGQWLLDELVRGGLDITAAAWVKPVEDDRQSLYVVSKDVDLKGPLQAYRAAADALGKLADASLSMSEIKLIGPGEAVAVELLDLRRRFPGRFPRRSRQPLLGGMPVEEVYLYAPVSPREPKVRQTVLRFVLKTADNPVAVMDQLSPGGRKALNRTEWRGKEPRSCGVTSVKGRPFQLGSKELIVFDVEVSYRPKGCITYSGGTRYDGWTAMMLDRAKDGTLLDGQGNPLPNGHPPVYRPVEVYEDIEFNDIDFGEFIGEFEVEGVGHVSYEYVLGRIERAERVNASVNSSFVAPRRNRPRVKIILSNAPSGTGVDGFGTRIVSINNSTTHLQQILLDQVTEVVCGYIEGRYSIKNMSTDEFVFAELDDILVDCTPNETGKESRFRCLGEYLPEPFLDELAMRLVATYEVDVSVVVGTRIGLLIKRVKRFQ